MMLRSFMALALMAALLQGCGGGGSGSSVPESTQPSSPPSGPTPPSSSPSGPTPPASSPVVQVGDFELVAGTLDINAPAGAPRCQSGPALGAALVNAGYTGTGGNPSYYSKMAVGRNGHIYWLSAGCDASKDSLNLIEIDPSTGQMRVQPVPYDPAPKDGLVLTQVYRPVAIAVASDGSVLIADGGSLVETYEIGSGGYNPPPAGPAGIWRFKNGVLSKVAGFDRPVPLTKNIIVYVLFYSFPLSEDGIGGNATFSYQLSGLCAGPNDVFYVYEGVHRTSSGDNYGGEAYRKLSLNGTVETITKFNYEGPRIPVFSDEHSFMCAANQRVFGSVSTGNSNTNVFGDLVSSQTFGQEKLSPPFSAIPHEYGFGDGLAISHGEKYGLSYLIITDLKHGEIKVDSWINGLCGSHNCLNPDANFQLNKMPYSMPTLPEAVVDDNNRAYLRSGNALLRYKLPDSVQPQ